VTGFDEASWICLIHMTLHLLERGNLKDGSL
jgi:hypothetical protein